MESEGTKIVVSLYRNKRDNEESQYPCPWSI